MNIKNINPDYFKILEFAIKAPSGHNTQPWKFKLSNNNIQLYPDFSRSLPVVDKYNRELYISIGSALQNLYLAANELGYSINYQIIQQDDYYFVNIDLEKLNTIPDKLFKQILKRQTNRSIYNGKTISNDIITQLVNICNKSEIHCLLYSNEEKEFNIISNLIRKANELQMLDKEFKKELKSWLRFNNKQVNNKKDGLAFNIIGAPSMPESLGNPIIGMFLKPQTQSKADNIKIVSSSHLVIFTAKEDNPRNWILLGQYLEKFLLKCTELNISFSFLNQPIEVDELRILLQKELSLNHEFPCLILRIGYAEPVEYSARKPIEDFIIN